MIFRYIPNSRCEYIIDNKFSVWNTSTLCNCKQTNAWSLFVGSRLNTKNPSRRVVSAKRRRVICTHRWTWPPNTRTSYYSQVSSRSHIQITLLKQSSKASQFASLCVARSRRVSLTPSRCMEFTHMWMLNVKLTLWFLLGKHINSFEYLCYFL